MSRAHVRHRLVITLQVKFKVVDRVAGEVEQRRLLRPDHVAPVHHMPPGPRRLEHVHLLPNFQQAVDLAIALGDGRGRSILVEHSACVELALLVVGRSDGAVFSELEVPAADVEKPGGVGLRGGGAGARGPGVRGDEQHRSREPSRHRPRAAAGLGSLSGRALRSRIYAHGGRLAARKVNDSARRLHELRMRH